MIRTTSFTRDFRLKPFGFNSHAKPMATKKTNKKWGDVLPLIAKGVLFVSVIPAFYIAVWSAYFISQNSSPSVVAQSPTLMSATTAFYSATASDEQNLDALLADLINNAGVDNE